MYTNATSFRGWPSNYFDEYFLDLGVCCKTVDWLGQWIRDIGEAIGLRDIF